MDWEECKSKKVVKETKVDKNLILSLIKGSDRKMKTNEMTPLNKDSASTKVCIIYDSLREILEAVSLKKGFKVYNHECYTGFLKDVLVLEKEWLDFDRFRRIRNSINYYGKDISIEEAKNIINEIIKLRKLLKEKFL